MKNTFLHAVALSLSAAVVLLLSSSAAFGQKAGGKGTTDETYMVIKIIDDNKTDNKVEYKAIATSQYKDEEKRVKDDNTEKLKVWHDLRKTDPTAPMPKKILIKKIPKLTGYLLQKDAQEAADKLRDEESGKAPKKPVDNKQ